MEKEQLASLITRFDEFVELSLQKKQSDTPLEELPQNQMEKYLQDMEKRLKLKAPTQQDKFDKMLSNVKNLKSFISIKDFMEQLGTQTALKKKTRIVQPNPAISIKEQYQNARGGVYLQKVQEHLKRKKNKRKEKAVFCTELEYDPFCPSDFGNWMENTLNKINPKPEQMFHANGMRETIKTEEEDCLLQEHRKTYRQQFKVKPKLRQQCTQQYEQFSKISSLLTNRLRKLLKSNCAPKNSKMDIIDSQRAETPIKRNMTHRTSLKVKFEKSKVLKKSSLGRVKTAGCFRKDDSEWKQNINERLKHIIETEKNLDD